MKKLNWPQLISDISEALVLTQSDLGKAIGTTQQSVSNWLNGRRTPSEAKARKFFELAEQTGIDPDNYKVSKKATRQNLKKQAFKALPLNIRKLSLTLSELPTRRRNTIIRYLEDMMDTFQDRD